MKILLLAVAFAFGIVLSLPGRAALDPALQDREWLLQVALYTYYWYLDDSFFAAIADADQVDVWVRSTEPRERDAGDRSRFGEVWLPAAKVLLKVKYSDYVVPELGVPVQSIGYRVRQGSYESAAPGDVAEWTTIKLGVDDVKEGLKLARRQAHVPGPETKQIVVDLLRREMGQQHALTDAQRFFIAARTGVATDVWVFWENQRALLQISGDMDLTDPAMVAHRPLLVRKFDLKTNVVASLIEAQGTNAFISRDRASRVLFLCLARGEEMVLTP